MDVTAKVGKFEHVIAVEVGEDLAGLVELVGEEVAYHYAVKGIALAARAVAAGAIRGEKTPPVNWVPVIVKRGKTPAEKILALLAGLGAEERAAVVAGLGGGEE